MPYASELVRGTRDLIDGASEQGQGGGEREARGHQVHSEPDLGEATEQERGEGEGENQTQPSQFEAGEELAEVSEQEGHESKSSPKTSQKS